jgi:hypothetical protein
MHQSNATTTLTELNEQLWKQVKLVVVITASLIWGGIVLPFGAMAQGPSDTSAPTNQVALEPLLIAPLFITNARFSSVLTLRNGGHVSMEVVLLLTSLEGKVVAQRQVQLPAVSSKEIALDDVEMASHRFDSLGSLTVSGALRDAVEGYVTIQARSADLQLEEKLVAVTATRGSKVANLGPSSSVPVVAIRSLSPRSQPVTIECTAGNGEYYESSLTLPSNMTFLLNPCIARRADARRYDQILGGDLGLDRGPASILVRGDNIAAWGFASSIPAQTRAQRDLRQIEFRVR